MKYFASILISLCLWSGGGLALAAKEVPGTAPVLPPLQPTPEGQLPNYSGNVQYQGDIENWSAETPSGGEESASSTTVINPAELVLTQPPGYSAASGQGGEQGLLAGGGWLKNIFFFILLVVLIIAGSYYWRREK